MPGVSLPGNAPHPASLPYEACFSALSYAICTSAVARGPVMAAPGVSPQTVDDARARLHSHAPLASRRKFQDR